MGGRVIGHLVLIRSDVTSRSSSSFPDGLRPLAEVGSRNLWMVEVEVWRLPQDGKRHE